MRYENEICPVCGKAFAQGDDIVVCPECGTPYHRACYEKIGSCSHNTEYARHAAESEAAKSEGDDRNGAPDPEIEDFRKIKCPSCGKMNNRINMRCTECGEMLRPGMNVFDPFAPQDEGPVVDLYEKDAKRYKTIYGDDELCGFKLFEIAYFIRSKHDYYIGKFKKMDENGSSIGWNWASALFGPLWFFYRKMRLYGWITVLAMVALRYIGSVVPELLFKAFRPELYEQFTSLAQTITQKASDVVANPASVSGATELMSLMRQFYTSPVFLATIVVSAAFALITVIVLGALGNSIYFSWIRKNIDRMNKMHVDTRMGRYFMIYSKGGVSATYVLIPVLAYFAASLITGLV